MWVLGSKLRLLNLEFKVFLPGEDTHRTGPGTPPPWRRPRLACCPPPTSSALQSSPCPVPSPRNTFYKATSDLLGWDLGGSCPLPFPSSIMLSADLLLILWRPACRSSSFRSFLGTPPLGVNTILPSSSQDPSQHFPPRLLLSSLPPTNLQKHSPPVTRSQGRPTPRNISNIVSPDA